jgi:putative transcriptional regulator
VKNRLRVLRAARGWSQAELAERLEVSRQSVNAIETGKFDPSLPLASGYRDCLGKILKLSFWRSNGWHLKALCQLDLSLGLCCINHLAPYCGMLNHVSKLGSSRRGGGRTSTLSEFLCFGLTDA